MKDDDAILRDCNALDDAYAQAETQGSMEDDLARLIEVVNEITQNAPRYNIPTELMDRLINSADAVEAWMEETDDPRANGWVDDRGRP
jgi:hypothetical protein